MTAPRPTAPGPWLALAGPYRPPYDWDALIAFLGARAITGVETVGARRYCRAIAVDGEAGIVSVSPAPCNRLAVTLHMQSDAAMPAILARVRNVFDLSADPRAIAEHLSRDPDLAPRVAARPGLRVPGAWDGFELAVRAILGQQITVHAATALAARLARDHGAPLPASLAGVETGITHLFPSAEAIARADLTSLPMPRARSSALSALARAAADDPTLFAPGHDLEAAVRRLCALQGLGPWTAQYIALRALREPDAFPAADVGLQRALLGPDGLRPSAADLLARAEAWRPWRAYAALHLWTTPTLPAGTAHASAVA
jgi:AraC family transcriptional regulator of adaptative response / DNA-3-methyladenine glycosylase II